MNADIPKYQIVLTTKTEQTINIDGPEIQTTVRELEPEQSFVLKIPGSEPTKYNINHCPNWVKILFDRANGLG